MHLRLGAHLAVLPADSPLSDFESVRLLIENVVHQAALNRVFFVLPSEKGVGRRTAIERHKRKAEVAGRLRCVVASDLRHDVAIAKGVGGIRVAVAPQPAAIVGVADASDQTHIEHPEAVVGVDDVQVIAVPSHAASMQRVRVGETPVQGAVVHRLALAIRHHQKQVTVLHILRVGAIGKRHPHPFGRPLFGLVVPTDELEIVASVRTGVSGVGRSGHSLRVPGLDLAITCVPNPTLEFVVFQTRGVLVGDRRAARLPIQVVAQPRKRHCTTQAGG